MFAATKKTHNGRGDGGRSVVCSLAVLKGEGIYDIRAVTMFGMTLIRSPRAAAALHSYAGSSSLPDQRALILP